VSLRHFQRNPSLGWRLAEPQEAMMKQQLPFHPDPATFILLAPSCSDNIFQFSAAIER